MNYFCLMIFADTHTHLYLNAFDSDRSESIHRAINTGVKYFFLPNIDTGSINSLMNVCRLFPENCFPLMALHPTDVKENYESELCIIREFIENNHNIIKGIGETGIDLYWDKTFLPEQMRSLSVHADWALEFDLPLIIHSRESHDEIFDVLNTYKDSGLKGVFHCFSGNLEQAHQIIDFGFHIGIGGPVTYKNGKLADVIKQISLQNILLETDSPFLPPVPHRGERNESSYIQLIAEKIAEIKGISIQEVAEITTLNALKLFNINN